MKALQRRAVRSFGEMCHDDAELPLPTAAAERSTFNRRLVKPLALPGTSSPPMGDMYQNERPPQQLRWAHDEGLVVHIRRLLVC